jgi:RHS repeat-associated protein
LGSTSPSRGPRARAPILTDALGSTLRLTDGNAAKLVDYTYEPYGETTADASSTNPFQYTGRENDGTGLYYYRARYYDAVLKRFVSEDPIGFAGGINLYSYASESPTTYTDVRGLAPGDRYVTIDGAAYDAIVDINATSTRENVEYGGTIYIRSDGFYSYTAPVRGSTSSVRIDSSNPATRAWYHTHGGHDPRYESEQFSPDDKGISDRRGIPGYVGTPSWAIKGYTPNPKVAQSGTQRSLPFAHRRPSTRSPSPCP